MVSLRNPGRHETDLLTWKEGLESDGFLVISVAVLMVMKDNNQIYSQAIQDYFDPSHLAAMRTFSEDLLRGEINASQHRSGTAWAMKVPKLDTGLIRP